MAAFGYLKLWSLVNYAQTWDTSKIMKDFLAAMQTCLPAWWSEAASCLRRSQLNISENSVTNAYYPAPQNAHYNLWFPSNETVCLNMISSQKNGFHYSCPEWWRTEMMCFNQWMPVCKIAIFRKSLVLAMKTSQRPSSISVLMEVRLVTAMTRGFFFPLAKIYDSSHSQLCNKNKKTLWHSEQQRLAKDKQGQASLKGKLFKFFCNVVLHSLKFQFLNKAYILNGSFFAS